VTAEWGASENNRRARYYRLTSAGRKQLDLERKEFQNIVVAIQKVLESA
jgi:DNA-binding PadR family transcriptional regulator